MDFEKVAAMFQQRLAETVARYEADMILMRIQHEEELEKVKNGLVEANTSENPS